MNESLISTSTTDNSIEHLQKELPIQTIKTIATLLNTIIFKNHIKKSPQPQIDNFFSGTIPLLSLEDYLLRIVNYTQIQIPTILSSIIYIAHIIQKKNYILCVYNAHRIILASCLISAKFNEDTCHSSSFYAQVGGISKKELDVLEYDFYVLNDFSLFIQEKVYQKYYALLVKDEEGNIE